MAPSIASVKMPRMESIFVRMVPYSSLVRFEFGGAAEGNFEDVPFKQAVFDVCISDVDTEDHRCSAFCLFYRFLAGQSLHGLFVRSLLRAGRPCAHLSADDARHRINGGRRNGVDDKFKDKVQPCAADDEEIQNGLPVRNEVCAERIAHQQRPENKQPRIDDGRRQGRDNDGDVFVFFRAKP